MTPHEFDATTRAVQRLLGKLAVTALVLLALFLIAACTVCPDEQCPVFPTAAPRR